MGVFPAEIKGLVVTSTIRYLIRHPVDTIKIKRKLNRAELNRAKKNSIDHTNY